MITTKDIAQRLQVSISTVGRALSDDPRISQATRQRVQNAAREMGYVAHRAARMLRGSGSNMVALMLPDIRHSFYSTVAHALSECLEKEQFQLTLSETGDDPARELRHLRELAGAQAAGVILVPSMKPLPELARLLRSIPHVQLLRHQPSLGDLSFGIDFSRAVEDATRHLLQRGHRRIAYLGADASLSTATERLRGFRAAMREADAQGLEVQTDPSDAESGRQAVRRLLALRTKPTAVIVGSVRLTYAVLDELRALNVQVPDELSVIGFGDEPGFNWWGPGLTTVSLPVADLATTCALWFVHHQLKHKGTPPVSSFATLSSATLIVRGSTAEARSARTTSPRRPTAQA